MFHHVSSCFIHILLWFSMVFPVSPHETCPFKASPWRNLLLDGGGLAPGVIAGAGVAGAMGGDGNGVTGVSSRRNPVREDHRIG
jgi:hypothetical protein